MKKLMIKLVAISLLSLFPLVSVYASDDDFFNGMQSQNTKMRPVKLFTTLSGFNEVPAFSTMGRGRFKAVINKARTEVAYTLMYEMMEGDVFMAHIHIGERHTNSGIMVWFCGDAGALVPPPPGVIVPPCGAREGVFEGIFTAENVLGPASRNVSPGNFEAFLNALEAGATYVNVHSLLEPPGEVRGQIRSRHPHAD